MRVVIFTFLFALCAPHLGAAPEYPRMGPDIYDVAVPGDALIGAALKEAAHDGKRVLVLFGANWCPWCRRLQRTLTEDAAVRDRLRLSYVLVHVDANTRRNKQRNAAVIARFGNPLRFGLPVFVVLAADGTPLTTRETQSLDASAPEEIAKRLRVFLDEWAK